jgi:ABC-type glycerol-3-phosphate transport system permease component
MQAVDPMNPTMTGIDDGLGVVGLSHPAGARGVPADNSVLAHQFGHRVIVAQGELGLYNSWAGLPILYAGHVLPFAVWVTRAHFNAIPRELEQAAQIDGYSRAEAVWRVVLPGARPALLAAATFGFLHSWNDYVTAATMLDSPDKRTLTVALIFFQGFHGRDRRALMAGAIIATIPPVVMFLLFRRYLIGGFSDGSVKG